MTRFAEGTSVPMERSRAEAERILVRYGATGFAYAWEQREVPYPHPATCPRCKGTGLEPGGSAARCGRYPYGAPKTIVREVVVLGFKMPVAGGVRAVQLEVPMPHETETGSKARADAATRQRWRALVLVLKAKLEAVASGISTLEAEFLANIVMQDGRTIGAAILHRIPEACATGRLLPPAGGAA